MLRRNNIVVKGRRGTWYVIDDHMVEGSKYFLLEHEEYGDLADHIVVNARGEEMSEDVAYRIKEIVGWD